MTNDYGNLELHTVLLAAMKDFNRVCEKHNLQYILHGGTCLGAVRHRGFIPWDDDVDIAMLREDYDRFLRVAPSELGAKYTIQTYKSEPSMLTNVMKISINDSQFAGTSGASEDGKAFLDIFPMSDIPNSKWLQKVQNQMVIFLNNCVYAKLGYITLESWKSKLVLGTFSKIDRIRLGNMIEWCIKQFPHRNSKYVDIVATANYNGNTGYAWDLIPKTWLTEIEYAEFEGCSFPISKHWDEYLSSRYGNYMVFPPESERVNKHNMVKIQ